jgi:hypothetical protein
MLVQLTAAEDFVFFTFPSSVDIHTIITQVFQSYKSTGMLNSPCFSTSTSFTLW